MIEWEIQNSYIHGSLKLAIGLVILHIDLGVCPDNYPNFCIYNSIYETIYIGKMSSNLTVEDMKTLAIKKLREILENDLLKLDEEMGLE